MKLIYVLPPVLALLLGVELLFGDDRFAGTLTDDRGNPKALVGPVDAGAPAPEEGKRKAAVLVAKNPWSKDDAEDGLSASGHDEDGIDEVEGFDAAQADGAADGPATISAAITSPPLPKPRLTVSGATVSSPMPELFEN